MAIGALGMMGLQLGSNLVQKAIGGGMGIMAQKWENKQQLEQQKKLQELQMQGQREMTDYNMSKQLEMWDKTNYKAQREQMMKAGLNVGLMYGGSGAGGATTNVAQGNVGGSSYQGGQLGMMLAQNQIDMQKQVAEIKLLNAQANKANVEAKKTEGVDTQQTTASTELTKLNTELAKIQRDVNQETQNDLIIKTHAEMWKAIGEANTAHTNGEIDVQMKEERIKQIKQTTAETDLRIATMKKGIQVSDEQIKSIANQIWISREANARGERSVDIDARDLARKISETEFKTNDAEHVKQWTSIITDLLKVIK